VNVDNLACFFFRDDTGLDQRANNSPLRNMGIAVDSANRNLCLAACNVLALLSKVRFSSSV
jgi:hypothetical protein